MEITIPQYRRVLTEDGRGYRGIQDGTLTGEIELWVDHAKLAQLMGPRALRSKAKKSILAGGAIVARATKLRREGGQTK